MNLQIDKDGKVWLIPDCPAVLRYTDYIQHSHYHWQVKDFEKAKRKYEKDLAAAPKLLVYNQETAKELINYTLYGGPQVDIPWSVVVNAHSGEVFDIPNVKWTEKEESWYEPVYLGQATRVVGKVAVINLPETPLTPYEEVVAVNQKLEKRIKELEDDQSQWIAEYNEIKELKKDRDAWISEYRAARAEVERLKTERDSLKSEVTRMQNNIILDLFDKKK
jgi:cell division protein FtsB